MELSLDKGDGLHIRSYQDGQFRTDEKAYSTSIIITAQKAEIWRPKTLDDVCEEDLLQLLTVYGSSSPQLVILGTGLLLEFPPVSFFRCFIDRKIGYEVMDTAAACRTYNVLMTENRAVVAGLLVGK